MTDKERIIKVIEWSKLKTNAFSKEIGYERAMTLYHIINEGRAISKNVATKICNRYPEINEAWLLTGTGDMLLSNNNSQIPDISNQTIEESLSNNLYMNSEVKDLKKLVSDLMQTVRDQAVSLKDYAAAEKDNARTRASLADTVNAQARAIENMSKVQGTKNGKVAV